MILALDSNHIKQIGVSRSSSYKAINNRVTCQHVVDKQRVHGRDIAMYGIVINAIAVCVIFVAAGRTNNIIEYPSA